MVDSGSPGPAKTDTGTRARIVEYAKLGTTYDGTAAAVGIFPGSLLRWRDNLPGFADQLAREGFKRASLA